MASFDITSLFKNIPLSETIDICTNRLFEGVEQVRGFNKEQFREILKLAVEDNIFIFDGKYYKQHDGVGMGSPLSCSMANLFLCHFESLWLDNCPLQYKPLLYRRYVDDTFLVFRSSHHVPLFLDYLNKQHSNIKFTSETESNDTLAFLDINISRVGEGFKTSFYRKPTFTGLTTKFSSFIPISYKRNLVLIVHEPGAQIQEITTIRGHQGLMISSYF